MVVSHLKCLYLDEFGFGVCKKNGITYFIESMLEQEIADVEIYRKTKTKYFGKILRLVSKSNDRNNDICKNYHECGGCSFMHLNYEKQLLFKRNLVKKAFLEIASIDIEVEDCIPMEYPFYYRNKVQTPYGYKDDNIIAGIYKENTHEIVDLVECLVEPKIQQEITTFMKHLFHKYRISIYDEETNTGFIKYVNVRHSSIDGRMMLIIVATSKEINHLDQMIEDIRNRFFNIKSIILNVNDKKTNTILSDNNYLLFGSDYIIDEINSLKFSISANSFFQINNIQTRKLYEIGIGLLELNSTSNVIDAYSGIGSIGLLLANQVKMVYGIEVAESSFKNALINKRLNNIDNIEFILGPCEKEIKKLVSRIDIDAIVFDPPRKGCDEEFLECVVDTKIKQILYISCNVKTQARDIKYLLENGYELKRCIPVDLFCHTLHVESATILVMKNK